jgi:hypothetical protein
VISSTLRAGMRGLSGSTDTRPIQLSTLNATCPAPRTEVIWLSAAMWRMRDRWPNRHRVPVDDNAGRYDMKTDSHAPAFCEFDSRALL